MARELMSARPAASPAGPVVGIEAWLLDADPAIRWQVRRDILDEPPEGWQQERAKVASEGWGAALIAAQDPAGTWSGRLYAPKWTSTHYTLQLLRHLGLPGDTAAARAGARTLFELARWPRGGIVYDGMRPELCIQGMALAIGATFLPGDPRIDGIVRVLLEDQLDDGGWNCRSWRGDRHSSFNTTVLAIEGLTAYELAGGSLRVRDAIHRAIEFMLVHRMFRSHTTGNVINSRWLKPTFPPEWHYDTLRGLDAMREIGAGPDERAQEAIEGLRQLRREDGAWPAGPEYKGQRWLRVEPTSGPSRWNTLRALRVLRWWDEPHA